MKKTSLPIVVCCTSFDEASGGNIVSHYLVDRLRHLGVEAYAYPPAGEHSGEVGKAKKALRRGIRHAKLALGLKKFSTHPALNVPLAPFSVLRNAIVVYPEVIEGNPLRCPHVVRWILFTPRGFDLGPTFETEVPGEEVFYFQRLFVKAIDWIPEENWLRLQWMRTDLFFDEGNLERSEVCRMVRKGTSTINEVPPDARDATILDDMSNEQIAAVFKRSKLFYCHDPYTMYCDYAAMCGCTPIVIPQPGVSRTDWRPEADRFGIAYGDSPEEIAWAQETRPKLFKRIEDLKHKEEKQLIYFLHRLSLRFEHNSN